MKIAIVVAKFNSEITNKMLNDAQEEIAHKHPEAKVEVTYVPGAVEIPYAAQRLARTKKFDAIIVFGAVIFGETDHYYYVSQLVSDGCMRVMLDESIPVIFGVLTVKNKEQALARIGGDKGNMGVEAAHAALEMIEMTDQLTQQ